MVKSFLKILNNIFQNDEESKERKRKIKEKEAKKQKYFQSQSYKSKEKIGRIHTDYIFGDYANVVATLNEMMLIEDKNQIKNEINQRIMVDNTTLLISFADNTMLIEMLLKLGAKPNLTDRYGMTSLMCASFSGNISGVKLLLESGADPNKKDKLGRTALNIAEKNGFTDIVKLLNDINIKREISEKAQEIKLKTSPKHRGAEFLEVDMPDDIAYCSDNDCDCGYPGEEIPRGNGYLYIPQSVVDFRKDALSLSACQMKLELAALKNEEYLRSEFGFNGPISYQHGGNVQEGIITPMLCCKKAASRRGLNLDIAASDAKYAWETGLAPLRATPLQK